MIDERDEVPDPGEAEVLRRLELLPADAHRWKGNGGRAEADHHQLVNAGSGPFMLRLEWTDERGGSTVHVGDYRMNLRALAARGYVQEKGKSVRLRFVRWVNGLVVIQANDASPWIAVGWARFDD